MSLKRKDLLSLAPLSAEEITLILQTADSFKEVTGREIKKVPALRGRTVVNLFFEPSTRTRTSFELAAKRLSADVINFSPSSSSVVKGETLLDTARNIEAMQADIIVLRHSSAGAAETLARGVKSSVINAGTDGMNIRPRPCSTFTRFASAGCRSKGFASPSLGMLRTAASPVRISMRSPSSARKPGSSDRRR